MISMFFIFFNIWIAIISQSLLNSVILLIKIYTIAWLHTDMHTNILFVGSLIEYATMFYFCLLDSYNYERVVHQTFQIHYPIITTCSPFGDTQTYPSSVPLEFSRRDLQFHQCYWNSMHPVSVWDNVLAWLMLIANTIVSWLVIESFELTWKKRLESSLTLD